MEVDEDKAKVLKKALELISENTMEISDTNIKRIIEISKKLCGDPKEPTKKISLEHGGDKETGFGVKVEVEELKKLENISEKLIRKELSEGEVEETGKKE